MNAWIRECLCVFFVPTSPEVTYFLSHILLLPFFLSLFFPLPLLFSQIAAMGLASVGIALVAVKVFKKLFSSWREARSKSLLRAYMQQRRAEAGQTAGDAGDSGGGAGGSGREEGDRAAGTCVVCLDRQSELVFTQCGHMCCCERCGGQVSGRCPVCRVRGPTIKVYRP